jgi:hypothetical protein
MSHGFVTALAYLIHVIEVYRLAFELEFDLSSIMSMLWNHHIFP